MHASTRGQMGHKIKKKVSYSRRLGALARSATRYERTSVSSGMISALQAAFFSSTGKLKWMRFNLCSKLRAGLQRICWLYLISGLTPPTSKNYRPLGGPKKGRFSRKKDGELASLGEGCCASFSTKPVTTLCCLHHHPAKRPRWVLFTNLS